MKNTSISLCYKPYDWVMNDKRDYGWAINQILPTHMHNQWLLPNFFDNQKKLILILITCVVQKKTKFQNITYPVTKAL
jgi:hypothetical protein